MPWTLVGEASSEWTPAAIASPYVELDYIEPGYFNEDEWTITAEPDQTWALVA